MGAESSASSSSQSGAAECTVRQSGSSDSSSRKAMAVSFCAAFLSDCFCCCKRGKSKRYRKSETAIEERSEAGGMGDGSTFADVRPVDALAQEALDTQRPEGTQPVTKQPETTFTRSQRTRNWNSFFRSGRKASTSGDEEESSREAGQSDIEVAVLGVALKHYLRIGFRPTQFAAPHGATSNNN